MSYYYKAEEVRKAAEGEWLSILAAMNPNLEPALRRPGQHVRCPVHGSKKRGERGDGFRLFKDAHRVGGGICNTCGPRHDGFELLMWLNSWDFKTCMYQVGDFIGAPRHKRFQPAQEPAHVNNIPKANQRKGRLRAKGVVIESGPAPYNHDPSNEENFFVTVRDHLGNESTVWGVDLSRAMHKAHAQRGAEVSLYSLGRKLVNVKQNVIDQRGEIVDVKEITAHRTEWRVVNHSAVAVNAAEEEFEQLSVSNGVSMPKGQRHSAAVRDFDDEGQETRVIETDNRKVVPLRKGDTPAWVQEVQERMEQQEQRRKQYSARTQERHQKVWDECLPLMSEAAQPAFTYLQSRDVHWVMDRIRDTDSLRFHPSLPYYSEDEKDGKTKLLGKFPALVAAVRDVDGNLLTLHRTYLSSKGGKAKVREVKKMAVVADDVDINGSAVRLGHPIDGILGVAEGMETALSAFRATGIATWSTVNAQLLKSFVPPAGIHTVIIWADKDKSLTGEVAANVLKSRLEEQGILVLVMLPPAPIPARAKSVDWNDVLMEQGRAGFPSRSYILRYCELNRSKAFAKVEYASALG